MLGCGTRPLPGLVDDRGYTDPSHLGPQADAAPSSLYLASSHAGMAGGDVVTALCGTPGYPGAGHAQGLAAGPGSLAAIKPPGFGTALCWGPAGASTAWSKALVSIFSSLRDLGRNGCPNGEGARRDEARAGRRREGAQLPRPWGGLLKGLGAADPHPTCQGCTEASLRMSLLATHWGHP